MRISSIMMLCLLLPACATVLPPGHPDDPHLSCAQMEEDIALVEHIHYDARDRYYFNRKDAMTASMLRYERLVGLYTAKACGSELHAINGRHRHMIRLKPFSRDPQAGIPTYTSAPPIIGEADERQYIKKQWLTVPEPGAVTLGPAQSVPGHPQPVYTTVEYNHPEFVQAMIGWFE